VTGDRLPFEPVKSSLGNLLGAAYLEAVCAARAWLTGEDTARLRAFATEKIDFFPATFQERLTGLLPRVGAVANDGLSTTARGAASAAFTAHSNAASAPLSAMGYLRVGERGHLFLTTKSEHYHVSVGHGFPGYELVDRARRLGIPNATHNNTRGHITRLLEEELVRLAAGIAHDDRAGLDVLAASSDPMDLNRVLNLETGSLAAEAALKIALSRFYAVQSGSVEPKYRDRTPVIVVLGNADGGLEANYHGTTLFTQLMRGMWPELAAALDRNELFLIRAVRPNDIEDLEAVFRTYHEGRFKIAAFFHELVLMNHGGIRLTEDFVRRAYALCSEYDVVPVVDEIQTGIWSPEIFMYKEYGVKPGVVVVGKGFPGGEYPASRVMFSAAWDTLPQFGALVTNGQEELGSLAYLITLRWAEANAHVTQAIGSYYEASLDALAAAYPQHICRIEGKRHMAGIFFHNLESAKAFVSHLNNAGIDISVQAYKEDCPPSALTKLPLIAGYDVVNFVIERMEEALKGI